MRKRIVRLALAAVAAAGLVTGGVAAATPASARPGASVASTPPPVPTSIPDEAVGALEEFVNAEQDYFGGVSSDPTTRTATVTVPAGAPEGDARAMVASFLRQHRSQGTAGAAGWRLAFHPVRHSLRQLNQIMGKVQQAQPWAGTARKAITEYYVDAERNAVSVGVEKVTPSLTHAAERTFGETVVLHQAAREHRMFSRLDDWPAPHYAGSRISTSRGLCTAAFGVLGSNGVNKYFLTAGHCFGDTSGGETVFNNNRAYGTLIVRSYRQNGPDSAVLSSDFAGRSYAGTPTSSFSLAVHGTATPPAGGTVCLSGSFTGENCSGRRDQTNICVTFTDDGQTTCNLTRAKSANGSRLGQGGDSGGPAYVRNSGSVSAVGTIIGGNDSGTTVEYHPIGYLLNLHNVTLLTQ